MTKISCVYVMLCMSLSVVCGQIDSGGYKSVEEQVKKALQRNATLLETPVFFLKCERLDCKDVLKSKFSGGDIPLIWELQWNGNEFYTSRQFFPTESQANNEEVFITDEPHVIVLRNGEICEWEPGRNVCYVDTFESRDINLLQEYEVFELLGINAAQKIIEAAGEDYPKFRASNKGKPGYKALDDKYLVELISQESYSIRPEKEEVDHSQCVVINFPKKETIWLDPNMEYALKKRLVYDDATGQIEYVANYLNYKKIGKDYYLPSQVIVDYYANPVVEPKGNWGKVAKRIVYAMSLQTDKAKATHWVSPPAGTRVIDGIRKVEYTISVPGSDPFAGPLAQAFRLNRYVVIRSICIIVGSVLILLAVWLKLRKQGAA